MSLPQCEQVRSRGYEMIYLTGALDEMVIETLMEQDGKKFCNVVRDDLGFETDEEKKAAEEKNAENKDLLEFVQETLGGEVAKVKMSNKLGSQPCALTTEGGITLEMEKYFSHSPSEGMRSMKATRVLELNPDSKAVKAMKAAFDSGDKEKSADTAKILNTLAKMMAGVDIEDPAEFTKLISELF
jgi:molecular chaperone HtpG